MDDLGAYGGIGIREAYEDLDKAEALAGDSINMKHPDYGAGATDSFMLLESDWKPPWQMPTVPWHEKWADDADERAWADKADALRKLWNHNVGLSAENEQQPQEHEPQENHPQWHWHEPQENHPYLCKTCGDPCPFDCPANSCVYHCSDSSCTIHKEGLSDPNTDILVSACIPNAIVSLISLYP